MPSPVDTSVKHYRSDMPGAPVVNGLAGSKIAQLEACLVTGYGLKAAATLTVLGGIATMTFAAGHCAWPECVILVAGAANPLLNGEQKVIDSNATTLTFATTAANGSDAGAAITAKIAPAGWEKVFSKTNVAVFRSLSPESARMYLRVDDTAVQTCRVRGFEQMSDVDTGTGPFPTDVMISGGAYWAKSDVPTAAAVAWAVVADARFFFDHQLPGSHRGMAFQNGWLRGFGDLLAKSPAGDAYLCALNASQVAAANNQVDGCWGGDASLRTFLPRGYTGLGSAVAVRRFAYTGGNHSGATATLGSFPSVVDGSLILSGSYVSDATTPRGDVPGHKFSPQSDVWSTLKMFDTVTVAGRRYLCCTGSGSGSGSSSSTTGVDFLDITGPWR